MASLGLRDCDDATLVRAVQAGDAEAYTELYNRYEPAVRRLCGRWLSDPLVVDDVVQNAFVRAFEHIDKCAGDSRFSGWVQVIAHRLCIDAGRAAARRRGAAEREANVPPSVPEDPVDAVLRNEQVDALQLAIAELPPRQREVVVARLVEGRRPSEIAATLGMTIAAVDSLLLRARKRLAAAYGTLVDEGGHMTLAAVTSVSVMAGSVSAAATRTTGVGRALRSIAVAVVATVAATAVPTPVVPRPAQASRPAVAAPVPVPPSMPAGTDDPVDSWSLSYVLPSVPVERVLPVVSDATAVAPDAVRHVLDHIIGPARTTTPAQAPSPAGQGPVDQAPAVTITSGMPGDLPVVPSVRLPLMPVDPGTDPYSAARPLSNLDGVREWRS